MVNKQHRNLMRLSGAIVLLGMSFVLLTHLLRSTINTSAPAWMIFALGVAPNFGAALSLPYLLRILSISISSQEHHSIKSFLIFAVVTFGGLAAWEFIQYLFWNYPMDPNDIAASGLGTLVAIGLYLLICKMNLQP